MTVVVFHPLADDELVEATRFYESRAAGLGEEFVREVERAIGHVITHPEAGGVFVGTVRCWLLRRFPYAVLYQMGPDRVLVIALMHLHRRPGYWRGRIRSGPEARS